MAGALSLQSLAAAVSSAAAVALRSQKKKKKTAVDDSVARKGLLQQGAKAQRVRSSVLWDTSETPTCQLSRMDGGLEGKLFFHGGKLIGVDQVSIFRPAAARSARRHVPRAEATASAPALSASAAGTKPATKRAVIRITMGDNLKDGMLGKARIVIIGDGKEIAEGPRSPIQAVPGGTSAEEDGFNLGFKLWKRGSSLTVTIDDLPKNVNPTVILLYNDSSHGRWFVKKVEIETEVYTPDGTGDDGRKKTYVFPCFSFVPNGNKGRIMFEGSSKLPWEVPKGLCELYREAALEDQFEVYKFDEYNDLSSPPDMVDRGSVNFRPRLRPYPKRQATSVSRVSVGIPVDDDFDLSKTFDFVTETALATARAVVADPAAMASNKPWKSVSALINGLFEGAGALRKPAILSSGVDWKSDKEFGRQTLAGINPMEITLVQALPEGFSVSDADLGDAMPAGLTLAAALRDRRVFIIDYSLLEGFREMVNAPPPPGKQLRYLYAPRCLFLRDNDGDVIPIAIELEKGAKVYTRAKDTSVGKWQWTLAKAYVASADSSVHQVGRHFLECHAVCEVYLIALRRRLSEWHPLFKLLIPHFRFTMSINYRARTSLINANGTIENNFTCGSKSMAASAELFKTWKFEDAALPNNLKKRGVHDNSVLPYYPYRDAGMLIWNAMHKYVVSYLHIYYGEEGEKASKAIKQDRELLAFWSDVRFGNSKFEFFYNEFEQWPTLNTLEDLAFICTTIMWTTSAQHAAVNFSQYDYSAFSPNHPACVRKPMPEVVDEKTFMDLMPLPRDQIAVLAVVDLLSRYSDDEEYIGRADQTAYGWLVDPAAQKVYKQFCLDLDEAEAEIERMNSENKVKGRLPYKYMFPRTNRDEYDAGSETPNGTEGIPNSVSI